MEGFVYILNAPYESNYAERLFYSLIKTTYSKKLINRMVISILTIIFRILADIVISHIVSTNYTYPNIIIQICVSVVLVVKSGHIYNFIVLYETEIYQFTRYIINNFPEKHNIWKRWIISLICLISFIYTYTTDITSGIIRLYIIQYFVCFIIIETISKKYHYKSFTYIDDECAINIQPNYCKPQSPNHTNNQINDLNQTSHESKFVLNDEFILNDEFKINYHV
jgi:hypothetical protein